MVKSKTLTNRNIILISSGLTALVLGLGLLLLKTIIMNFITDTILNLNSNSAIFDLWRKFPAETPTHYTFFNWTNPEEFLNKSVKPKFQEIGPYIFLQNMERVGIVKNDNDTITFQQLRNFTYNDVSNNGNLSAELTTLNFITTSLGNKAKYWDVASKSILSEFLTLFDPHYYLKTTAEKELLTGSGNIFIELLNYFDYVAPEIPRFDHFGWISVRNGDPNYDGVFNIGNGVNRNFEVLNWNYRNTTSLFEKSCSSVKGSMGDIYSIPKNKDHITIFASDVRRYVKLYFEKEVVVDGILGYKYILDKRTFDNGTLDPENYCFCNGECLPSGLINLTACMFGISAFASMPHFYNADPVYLDAVEGLSPEKNKHEGYLIIEPNSMIVIKFKIRFQFNTLVQSVEDISYFNGFQKLYFPLIWFQQESQMPDYLKFYFRLYLKVPIFITVIGAGLSVLGVLLIVKFVFMFRALKYEDYFKESAKISETVSLNTN